MNLTPGVDMTTGSLGQGISAACGMALGQKINKINARTFCLVGDGEIEEGQVWEALMFASHWKLNNFCVAVDNNGLQIDGKVEDVAGLSNIALKLKAFGFEVFEIDGHSFKKMQEVFNEVELSEKPCAIVLKTIKGKGVSFMENSAGWHGKALNEEELNLAVLELENLKSSLKN